MIPYNTDMENQRVFSGRIRQLLLWTVILLLTLMLFACDDTGEEADENIGFYTAVSASESGREISLEELHPVPPNLKLKDHGKASFFYQGKSHSSMTWSREGTHFEAHDRHGLSIQGKIGDGVLELTDVFGSGVDLRMECAKLVIFSNMEKNAP